MGDEQNGDALLPQFVNFAHTALAEVDVADRQGFVHDQDFGIDMDGDREGQADRHAARVRFHGLVDEVADLGKLFNLLEFPVHVAAREAQDGGVQIDIVASAEFRIEAGAQFQQGSDSSGDTSSAAGRLREFRRPFEAGCFCPIRSRQSRRKSHPPGFQS